MHAVRCWALLARTLCDAGRSWHARCAMLGRSLGPPGTRAVRCSGARWALLERTLCYAWALAGRSLHTHCSVLGRSLLAHRRMLGRSLLAHRGMLGRSLGASVRAQRVLVGLYVGAIRLFAVHGLGAMPGSPCTHKVWCLGAHTALLARSTLVADGVLGAPSMKFVCGAGALSGCSLHAPCVMLVRSLGVPRTHIVHCLGAPGGSLHAHCAMLGRSLHSQRVTLGCPLDRCAGDLDMSFDTGPWAIHGRPLNLYPRLVMLGYPLEAVLFAASLLVIFSPMVWPWLVLVGFADAQ